MTSKPREPFETVFDPYAGDSYILPAALCSDQRRLWFKRNNEILGFFRVAHWALQESGNLLRKKWSQGVIRRQTPVRIKTSEGWGVITSARRLHALSIDAVDILGRQVFVMLYGSLETYLLQLFERSFSEIGDVDNVLDRSLDILRKWRWDGKFCAMRDAFGLDYQASRLIDHFRGFEMQFGPKVHENPLNFLDEVAKVRHRIVHASSISEHGELFFLNPEILLPAHSFYVLLTDYVDNLFCTRFEFDRRPLDPAGA